MKPNKLNFNKLKIGDWIKYHNGGDVIVAKVLAKIKHGLISDAEGKVKTTMRDKNINAIGILEGRKRTWFRTDIVPTTKILDVKETGDLKDIAIRRYIKLKGLDQ